MADLEVEPTDVADFNTWGREWFSDADGDVAEWQEMAIGPGAILYAW
jgi:hypothetical protein